MPFWQFFRMGWDGCALLVRPSTIPHRNWKILFVLGANWYLERLEGKTRKGPFFKVLLILVVSMPWQPWLVFLFLSISLDFSLLKQTQFKSNRLNVLRLKASLLNSWDLSKKWIHNFFDSRFFYWVQFM